MKKTKRQRERKLKKLKKTRFLIKHKSFGGQNKLICKSDLMGQFACLDKRVTEKTSGQCYAHLQAAYIEYGLKTVDLICLLDILSMNCTQPNC